jgi:hypothetical protein
MGYSHIFPVTKTIVTDTNAYSSGDFVGTAILTLENVAQVDGCILETVTITDLTKQSLAIDFLFFKTACTNTTFTNNGALDIHDTDLLQFAGGVPLVAGDYMALADSSVGSKANICLALATATNTTSLYCVPVTRGTPTYDASALQVTFVFRRL